jgi:hypothetical protein
MVVKLTLRIAGGLALIVGVALAAIGGFAYFGLRGVAHGDTLLDTLDTIGSGVFGALLGVGLIVYAGRAPRRGA